MQMLAQDLFTWKCFLLTVQYGSVRQAAKVLELEPSSVSRRLANLSKELGDDLFVKNQTPLVLTPTGKLALKNFAPLLKNFDIALSNISRRTSSENSTLHIIAPIGYSQTIVRKAVAEFQKKFPSISFWLESGLYGDERFTTLGKGVDIIISTLTRQSPILHTEKISDHRHVCLAGASFTKDHPLTHPDQLMQLPLAGNTQFMANQVFTRESDGSFVSLPLSFALLSDNTNLLMEWAKDNNGVLIGSPCTAAVPYLKDGTLKLVLPDWRIPNNQVYAYATKQDFADESNHISDFFALLHEISDSEAKLADSALAEAGL
jgi:DNA-binding transcriptional LysR family regulator